MAIKVVLRVMLASEFGISEGNMVYKALMLYVMMDFLDTGFVGDTDELIQIMAKTMSQKLSWMTCQKLVLNLVP